MKKLPGAVEHPRRKKLVTVFPHRSARGSKHPLKTSLVPTLSDFRVDESFAWISPNPFSPQYLCLCRVWICFIKWMKDCGTIQDLIILEHLSLKIIYAKAQYNHYI